MRLAIATDAWAPQVNGVVRTLNETIRRLKGRGHEVEVISPDRFTTIACPGYPEIRLALAPRFRLRKVLGAFKPDLVHISTEGPIGWSARAWCLKHKVPFTTAFHTRFPEYVAARTNLSPDLIWPIMRSFHKGSRVVLTATQSLRDELESRGIHPTQLWSRGIDHDIFHARQTKHPALQDIAKPILLSVGRVAVEKNLEAFLDAGVPGTKVVVGDGPARAALEARAAALLPGLLLARVDGKSPVEYITEDDQRDLVRKTALPLLANPVDSVNTIAEAWRLALQEWNRTASR